MKLNNRIIIALIPSVIMALGTNFLELDRSKQSMLESFTAGLLVIGGTMMLIEFKENKSKKSVIIGLFGLLFSLFVIILSDSLLDDSVIPSLYLDSLSDGLLLGAVSTSILRSNKILSTLVPMSFEMMLVGSTTVALLIKRKRKNPKLDVTIGSFILFISVIIGSYSGKYVNENFIMGFGSGAMLWLGLFNFLPEIINFKENKLFNSILVVLGLISGAFLD